MPKNRKKKMKKFLIKNTGQNDKFISCRQAKDNNFKFKKREVFNFLSFFYKHSFFNPNLIFGFFLTKIFQLKQKQIIKEI